MSSRRALFLSAISARRADPTSRAYYNRNDHRPRRHPVLAVWQDGLATGSAEVPDSEDHEASVLLVGDAHHQALAAVEFDAPVVGVEVAGGVTLGVVSELAELLVEVAGGPAGSARGIGRCVVDQVIRWSAKLVEGAVAGLLVQAAVVPSLSSTDLVLLGLRQLDAAGSSDLPPAGQQLLEGSGVEAGGGVAEGWVEVAFEGGELSGARSAVLNTTDATATRPSRVECSAAHRSRAEDESPLVSPPLTRGHHRRSRYANRPILGHLSCCPLQASPR